MPICPFFVINDNAARDSESGRFFRASQSRPRNKNKAAARDKRTQPVFCRSRPSESSSSDYHSHAPCCAVTDSRLGPPSRSPRLPHIVPFAWPALRFPERFHSATRCQMKSGSDRRTMTRTLAVLFVRFRRPIRDHSARFSSAFSLSRSYNLSTRKERVRLSPSSPSRPSEKFKSDHKLNMRNRIPPPDTNNGIMKRAAAEGNVGSS